MRSSQLLTKSGVALLCSKVRISVGLTQSEWAQKLVCSLPTVVAIECGTLDPGLKLRAKMSILSGFDVIDRTGEQISAKKARERYLRICLDELGM